MDATQIYIGVPIINHLFNWWSIALWALAFVLMIMLLTSAWKYFWHVSITMAIIGWLCLFYAGFTGMWYMGWFGWTIFLSMALFVRGLVEYLNNFASDKEHDKT